MCDTKLNGFKHWLYKLGIVDGRYMNPWLSVQNSSRHSLKDSPEESVYEYNSDEDHRNKIE